MSIQPISNQSKTSQSFQHYSSPEEQFKNNNDLPLSELQEIDELESEISRKLEEMKQFKEEMKRRRVQKQIQEKEEENPFVVKQTYVDRELKKLNPHSGDLLIKNPGSEDEQETQRKVQQILKKINL